jgi:hypothetical protein
MQNTGNQNISHISARSIVVALCFFVSLLVLSLPRWDFLGDFMVHDDTIYLPKTFVGQPTESGFNQYRIYDMLGYFQSIELLKLFLLFIGAALAVTLTLLFATYTRHLALALLAAVSVVSFPVAVDQFVFVTGSHPTFSILFQAVALLVFSRSLLSGFGAYLWRLLACGALLCLAASFSPVGTLSPVALPLWLLLAAMFRGPSGKTVFSPGTITISLLPAFLYYGLSYSPYHYTNKVGWVDYSLAQVLTNLAEALSELLQLHTQASNVGAVLWFVFSGIFLATGVVALVRGRLRLHRQAGDTSRCQQGQMMTAAAGSLVLAILSFGPAAVTTSLLSRYLVASTLFCLVAIILPVLFWISRNSDRRFVAVAAAALLGLIFINTVSAHANTRFTFGAYLDAHVRLKQAIASNAADWADNAQVVFVLEDKSLASPTSGYNHWSSWYLRYWANRPDIIGLIGAEPTRSPFVNEYRDHGPEHWELLNGKSARKRMHGLEVARPTYAYRLAADAENTPYAGMAFSSEPTVFVKNGSSLAGGDISWSGDKRDPELLTWPLETSKDEVWTDKHFQHLGADNWLYRHDDVALHRLWIQPFDYETKAGEKVEMSLTLSSDQPMMLSVSLARHSTAEPYEGSAKTMTLRPGEDVVVHLSHVFEVKRKKLKAQLDVRECDAPAAYLMIKDVQLSPVGSSPADSMPVKLR